MAGAATFIRTGPEVRSAEATAFEIGHSSRMGGMGVLGNLHRVAHASLYYTCIYWFWI